VNPWDDIFSFKNENDEDKHDAQILRYQFLNQIEQYQDLQNLNKKKLSKIINTSASYLTQVFRGDKPLNFITLVKIARALGIKFNITASPIGKNNFVDYNTPTSTVMPIEKSSCMVVSMYNGDPLQEAQV
jgi:hypothetical protein